MNPELMVFLHVPKTAGSSLNAIFRRQYRTAELHFVKPALHEARYGLQSRMEDFYSLPPEKAARIKMLRGHFVFGPPAPESASYITFLRKPVPRVMSLYWWVREREMHYLHTELISRNISLHDFVVRRMTVETSNDQTRRIAGPALDADGTPVIEEDRAMLERAKRNIERQFRVVGLTEQFDSAVLLLKRALGWKTPYYRSLNVTMKKPPAESVPKATLDLIAAENALDLELYDWAKARFDDAIRQLGPSFQAELKRFQRLNRFWSLYFHLQHWRQRPRKAFAKLLGGRAW
jgi:galactose-3-O-sulfotransferase